MYKSAILLCYIISSHPNCRLTIPLYIPRFKRCVRTTRVILCCVAPVCCRGSMCDIRPAEIYVYYKLRHDIWRSCVIHIEYDSCIHFIICIVYAKHFHTIGKKEMLQITAKHVRIAVWLLWSDTT